MEAELEKQLERESQMFRCYHCIPLFSHGDSSGDENEMVNEIVAGAAEKWRMNRRSRKSKGSRAKSRRTQGGLETSGSKRSLKATKSLKSLKSSSSSKSLRRLKQVGIFLNEPAKVKSILRTSNGVSLSGEVLPMRSVSLPATSSPVKSSRRLSKRREKLQSGGRGNDNRSTGDEHFLDLFSSGEPSKKVSFCGVVQVLLYSSANIPLGMRRSSWLRHRTLFLVTGHSIEHYLETAESLRPHPSLEHVETAKEFWQMIQQNRTYEFYRHEDQPCFHAAKGPLKIRMYCQKALFKERGSRSFRTLRDLKSARSSRRLITSVHAQQGKQMNTSVPSIFLDEMMNIYRDQCEESIESLSYGEREAVDELILASIKKRVKDKQLQASIGSEVYLALFYSYIHVQAQLRALNACNCPRMFQLLCWLPSEVISSSSQPAAGRVGRKAIKEWNSRFTQLFSMFNQANQIIASAEVVLKKMAIKFPSMSLEAVNKLFRASGLLRASDGSESPGKRRKIRLKDSTGNFKRVTVPRYWSDEQVGFNLKAFFVNPSAAWRVLKVTWMRTYMLCLNTSLLAGLWKQDNLLIKALQSHDLPEIIEAISKEESAESTEIDVSPDIYVLSPLAMKVTAMATSTRDVISPALHPPNPLPFNFAQTSSRLLNPRRRERGKQKRKGKRRGRSASVNSDSKPPEKSTDAFSVLLNPFERVDLFFSYKRCSIPSGVTETEAHDCRRGRLVVALIKMGHLELVQYVLKQGLQELIPRKIQYGVESRTLIWEDYYLDAVHETELGSTTANTTLLSAAIRHLLSSVKSNSLHVGEGSQAMKLIMYLFRVARESPSCDIEWLILAQNALLPVLEKLLRRLHRSRLVRNSHQYQEVLNLIAPASKASIQASLLTRVDGHVSKASSHAMSHGNLSRAMSFFRRGIETRSTGQLIEKRVQSPPKRKKDSEALFLFTCCKLVSSALVTKLMENQRGQRKESTELSEAEEIRLASEEMRSELVLEALVRRSYSVARHVLQESSVSLVEQVLRKLLTHMKRAGITSFHRSLDSLSFLLSEFGEMKPSNIDICFSVLTAIHNRFQVEDRLFGCDGAAINHLFNTEQMNALLVSQFKEKARESLIISMLEIFFSERMTAAFMSLVEAFCKACDLQTVKKAFFILIRASLRRGIDARDLARGAKAFTRTMALSTAEQGYHYDFTKYLLKILTHELREAQKRPDKLAVLHGLQCYTEIAGEEKLLKALKPMKVGYLLFLLMCEAGIQVHGNLKVGENFVVQGTSIFAFLNLVDSIVAFELYDSEKVSEIMTGLYKSMVDRRDVQGDFYWHGGVRFLLKHLDEEFPGFVDRGFVQEELQRLEQKQCLLIACSTSGKIRVKKMKPRATQERGGSSSSVSKSLQALSSSSASSSLRTKRATKTNSKTKVKEKGEKRTEAVSSKEPGTS